METPTLQQIAEQHGRMVELAILKNHPARAHSVVDRAFAVIEELGAIRPDTSVAEIVGSRMGGLLISKGINTVEELCMLTPRYLVEQYGIRWRSVYRIEARLEKYNLKLRTPKAPNP